MKKIFIIGIMTAVLVALVFLTSCNQATEPTVAKVSNATKVEEVCEEVSTQETGIGEQAKDATNQQPSTDTIVFATTPIEVDSHDISWEDVHETADNIPYLTIDGKHYRLGLDFLANAMCYNCAPSGGLRAEEVFAKWYGWYMDAMAQAVPAVSLGHRYDYYGYQDIRGIETHPMNNWQGWDAARYWAPTDGDTLRVRDAKTDSLWSTSRVHWSALLNGKGLLSVSDEGKISYNSDVVVNATAIQSEEGCYTELTIRIRDDMHFSDGTPIQARHYVSKLVALTAAGVSSEYDALAKALVGYRAFADGTDEHWKGVRVTDDYTIKLVFDSDYAEYYWLHTMAALYPYPDNLYLNGANLTLTGDFEVGLSEEFDASMQAEGFQSAYTAAINNPLVATAGDYYVDSYDSSTGVYHLARVQGSDAASAKVDVYTRFTTQHMHIVVATDVQELNGQQYFALETKSAWVLDFVHEVGAARYASVRKAIACALDWHLLRESQRLSEEEGNFSVFPATYWAGDARLSLPNKDLATAEALVVADGWTYNASGSAYTKGDGVRYKLVAAADMVEFDRTISNADGSVKTIYLESRDSYLIPLLVRYVSADSSDLVMYGVTDLSDLSGIGFAIEKVQLNFLKVDEEMRNDASTVMAMCYAKSIDNVLDLRGYFVDPADAILVYVRR